MTDAAEIRARMRGMRRELGNVQQREAAQAVFAHVLALEEYSAARCVMAYIACRGELSLDGVIDDILLSGKTLALPRCEGPGVMHARRVERLDQLVPGQMGLMEPDPRCEIIEAKKIDLILAPGTAFDLKGHRIGQGGGYYDRFLPGLRAKVIGIGHDFAMHEQIPFSQHDVPMHKVITPMGVFHCEKMKAQEDLL